MTYFSLFRAIEVSQWKVKEALHADGTIRKLTRLRKEATKGDYPALAPVVVKEQRERLERWFAARMKYGINVTEEEDGKRLSLYRGEYKLTNQVFSERERIGIRNYYDQCATDIYFSFVCFKNMYVHSHEKPVGCGYLYTVTGGMRTAFTDKKELDAFLKAYNLKIIRPERYSSDVLVTDGDISKWQKLEWREI